MKRIYVDVHGVLLDFVGGLMEHHGITIPPKRWNFAGLLGMSEEKFWKSLDEYDFWNKLPKAPHADDLLDVLRACPLPLYAITRPMFHSLKAIEGTVHALCERFGMELNDIVIASDKGACASPYGFLIDDQGDNCNRWSQFDGYVFHWPAYYNGFLEYEDSESGWTRVFMNMTASLKEWMQ